MVAVLVATGVSPVALAGSEPHAPEVRDPVYIYYARGSCREESMEMEVWDREGSTWKDHPQHPTIPVESCQLEDAGLLLHEIRWRCLETKPAPLPATWVVGLDVFNPQVTERCTGAGRVKKQGDAEIHISSPPLGATIRNESQNVALEGSVRIGGLEGARYDVLLALDVSRQVGRGSRGSDVFLAEIEAARSFVSHVSHRLGDVRVGVVTFPNRQVARNDPGGTGARRDAPLGASYGELDRALRAVQARGTGSLQSFSSGLEFAVAELLGENEGSGARPDARKVLLIATDGRGDIPFGREVAASQLFREKFAAATERAHDKGAEVHFFALAGFAAAPPAFVQAAIGEGRGSFHRVLESRLGTAFFERVALPYVRRIEVVDLRSGRAVRDVALRSDGRFAATVPVERGENRLLITGVTSEGLRVEREIVVDFDDSLIRERLRAAERERMREARERRKQVEIEPVEPL
jgi:hypothetical protein